MPNSGLIVSGKLGIDLLTPVNNLDVLGAAAIGTYAGILAPTDGLIVSGASGFGTASPTASVSISRFSPASSGTAAYLQVDQVADSGLTFSTEAPTVLFNFSSATRTWAAGTLSLQRYFNVGQPTLAFSGSSVATNVATMGIVGSPIQGGSASITNSYGILVDQGGSVSSGIYQWVTATAVSSNTWNSIAWSPQLGIFVAVSSGGAVGNQVMVSTNGTTWTTGSVASSNNWTAVAWSPELGVFAAVALSGSAGNQVMTSSNGTSWSLSTAASSSQWFSICWSPSLGVFVAVSEINGSGTSQAMISTNGTSWTAVTPAISSYDWSAIAWSPTLGIFVAVGDAASTGTSLNNQIMISSDGVYWTSSTAPVQNVWASIAWSSSLNIFAAVGFDNIATQIIISTNGTTWIGQTSPGSSGSYSCRSIAWSPTLSIFVVGVLLGTGSATNQLFISSNGTSWSLMNGATTNFWLSIAWSPQLAIFAAVGSKGTAGNDVMIYQPQNFVTNSYGLSVNAQQGALNNYAAEFFGGAVSVGITTPDPSFILEIASTTQGFLPPAMTTAQKNGIANPANGLVVYDSTQNELNFYNGINWISPGIQLINKYVITANSLTISFINIPQNFNHLKIVCMGRCTNSSTVCTPIIQFNSDTGSHYNSQFLRVTGASSVGASINSNAISGILCDWTAANSTANYPGNCVAEIPCYTQTTFYKTVIATSTNISGTLSPSITEIWGSSWGSTNAITSITISEAGGGSFIPGSVFYLYGEN